MSSNGTLAAMPKEFAKQKTINVSFIVESCITDDVIIFSAGLRVSKTTPGNLQTHVPAFFLKKLFENHVKKSFEIMCRCLDL